MVPRTAGIGGSALLLDVRRRSADRFDSSRPPPAAGPATSSRPALLSHGPSARVFAEYDPAAAAGRGEGRQRCLCPNPDLPGAGRAAELLYAVGVHRGTAARVPQIAGARAERVRSLDPDIARVERKGITAFDAVPLEALE